MARLEYPESFWARVNKRGPSECWTWAGEMHHQGYGRFRRYIGGKLKAFLAHRLSYELANGAHPGRMHVCHRCDNPPCVNPAHLFLGTDADNVRDCVQKERRHTKITFAKAREIRRLYATGKFRQRDLASRFGISIPNVCAVVKNRIWVETNHEYPSSKGGERKLR